MKTISSATGNYNPYYQSAGKKTFWTKKKAVFLFMVVYGVAVSALMFVLIAKFI